MTCARNPIFRHCVMFLGNVIALPLFMHRGASAVYPERCDCTGEAGRRTNDSSYPCNLFSFLSGFIFYPTADPTPLVELGLRYSDAETLALSFPAMFAGSAFSESGAQNLSDPVFRNQSYDFCRVPSFPQGCSFVSFTSMDGDSFGDTAVSEYFLEISEGSCADSFSAPSIAWYLLSDLLLFHFC